MIDNLKFLNPELSFSFLIESGRGEIAIYYEGVKPIDPLGRLEKVYVSGSIGSREEYDAVINYLIGMSEILRKRKEADFPNNSET